MGGTMRSGNQIDLTDKGGSRTLSIAPGGEAQFQFLASQARIGASGRKTGMWNNARGMMFQCQMTVHRTDGSEAPIIYPDMFPAAITNIGLEVPNIGTMYDPNIIDGMIAKHVLEFFGTGYNRLGVSRQPIPAGNGDYVRNFEIFIPWSQGWNIRPDHFALWLGWLNTSVLQVNVDGSTSAFGLAGVSITSFTISVGVETFPTNELLIPPLMLPRRYKQTAAASSNGPILMNVGGTGGLESVDSGARLVYMLFCHQAGGFAGSGTADQIAKMEVTWRDQKLTNFASMFFERFTRAARLVQLGTTVSGGNIFDNIPPYPMSDNPAPTGPLNDASARYTPIAWVEKDAFISQIQKVKGNYGLDGMVFNAPQSNEFVVYTGELKQMNQDTISSLLVTAGIDPSQVGLIPKMAMKNNKVLPDSVTWGFPRSVVSKDVAQQYQAAVAALKAA